MPLLSNVRKYAYSWQMKAIYLLIALTFFGGFGVAGYLRSCTFVMDPNTVARIDGTSISLDAFQQAYNNTINALRDKLGDKFSEDMIQQQQQDIKKEVLRRLLQRTLILDRAEDLGLTVSDDELRAIIARMFSDEQGRFDMNRYRSALRANHLRVAQFEESEREDVLISKAQELVAGSVFVSNEEVTQEYRVKNEKVNLLYASFDPDAYKADLSPTDADLRGYFTAHTGDFLSPSTGGPPASTPRFEDVREKVREGYIAARSSDMARDAASALLAAVAGGKRRPRGGAVAETGFFSRGQGLIPKVGLSEEGIATGFSLTPSRPAAAAPVLIAGRYYAFWLKARQGIDPASFEKDRARFTADLLKEKRDRVIRNWIDSLVDKASIRINTALLTSFGTGVAAE